MKHYEFRTAMLDKKEHRYYIELLAEAGYNYVGYIPLSTTSEGEMEKVDLIFEREIP